MSLDDAARCLGLPGPEENCLLENVAIDSRMAQNGSLFACIPGSRVDGHDFVAQAIENGAVAILASRAISPCHRPVLRVADTTKALGALASSWRAQTKAKVICLTGTSGKTTLKESLKALLEQKWRIAATDKNHNNQIGLPLTMLGARGDEDFWLLEAGISHKGDMEELARIARPDLAIILNVGPGHTEGLGERGVAWHKTRLLQYLRTGGRALASADYPELKEECAALGVSPIWFSTRADSSAPFRVLESDPTNGEYLLLLAGEKVGVNTPFMGPYGGETAIAAAAAARLCGLDAEDMKKGFKSMRLPEQRFNMSRLGPWHIFDDTYNANPLSMRRMLEAAELYARQHGLPLFAVLGEMGELGGEAGKWHRRLGGFLAKIAPAAIYWKGGHFNDLQDGYSAAGGRTVPFVQWDESSGFARLFQDMGERGGVIIFKGSRANRLELCLGRFREMATQEVADVL